MKRNVYVGVLLTALLMTSCINTKRIVYLEDMKRIVILSDECPTGNEDSTG